MIGYSIIMCLMFSILHSISRINIYFPGRGAAMIIESLRLFYHLRCFQCCVCHVQLGNGASGTDVRVRNNKLHCQNCYSNDEGKHLVKLLLTDISINRIHLYSVYVKCLAKLNTILFYFRS